LLATVLATGGILTVPTSASAAAPVAVLPSGPPPLKLVLTGFVDTLTCGQELQKDDRATGVLDLRFQCRGDRGVVKAHSTLFTFTRPSTTRITSSSTPETVGQEH
jgi:hypothetical protein